MQSNDTQEDNYDQFWERIPQEFRFLFFRMPVLRSDTAFYRGFTIRLANTIGPQDFREWLLVKDIVDHTCYILFLRRVEMNMIDLATREALIVILTALSHGELADKVKQLAKGWFCGLEMSSIIAADRKVAVHEIERAIAGFRNRLHIFGRQPIRLPITGQPAAIQSRHRNPAADPQVTR